jgi:hypothetical protein
VFFRDPAQWAAALRRHAGEAGLEGSVCTVHELVAPDSGTELAGMDR